jgi:polynucleotide 5'-kinase involved in rRNA processing
MYILVIISDDILKRNLYLAKLTRLADHHLGEEKKILVYYVGWLVGWFGVDDLGWV